jgi:hypothetical protein
LSTSAASSALSDWLQAARASEAVAARANVAILFI